MKKEENKKFLHQYKIHAQDVVVVMRAPIETKLNPMKEKNCEELQPTTIFNEEILKTYSFVSEYLSLHAISLSDVETFQLAVVKRHTNERKSCEAQSTMAANWKNQNDTIHVL